MLRTPRRRVATRVAVALGCLVLVASGKTPPSSASPAPGDPATAPPDGRAIYVRACEPCHGAMRRGDGPEASSFAPPPSALTVSALEAVSEERLVARLRDGLPLTLAGDPDALERRLRHVEELTAHLQRLPEIDWKRVDEGRALYDAHCAACHGSFGKPRDAADLPPGVQLPPRDLRDASFQSQASDAELISAMRHGRTAMPAIPGVRDARDAASVVVFLRVLSPAFETYSTYCAGCHGDDGRGDGVLARGASRPPVAFDAAWRATKDPEQLRIDVVHMIAAHGATMPHFRGRLSDDELRAVVRHLKEPG